MLAKINKLTAWQAALIIAIIGFTVFFTGLNNPFQGDDQSQIVNNIPVHSITNLRVFFEGGTFYNGGGTAPLAGVYYRPLMTTMFSVIYSLFGPHPIYYHLVQLLLCVGSAILLFLVFRYSFKPILALPLALIFLVHPLNSQVVFAIPSMQDALFFFFGMLAFWLLLRFKSVKSLLLGALCLLLSLLSKETGILFVVMSLLYLLWWDRKRLLPFLGIVTMPIALWLVLKTDAIGFLGSNPNNAPVDGLSLGGRLMTDPSIMLFYLTKLVFPWKLASAYYWIYPHFSFRHVLLPLIIDLLALGSVVCLAFVIRRRATRAQYLTYLFFAIWTGVGLLPVLQIIPLDMTACETWFYFSMVGIVGMVGVLFAAFQSRIQPKWFLIVCIGLIGILGIVSAANGREWRSPYVIAEHDLSDSPDDYVAANYVAMNYFWRRNYTQATRYAERSIQLYPNADNYNALGTILLTEGKYPAAYSALHSALRYQGFIQIYNNLATLTGFYGNPSLNKKFLLSAVDKFPEDGSLWLYLALLEYREYDLGDAKNSISQAKQYSSSDANIPPAYYAIMHDKPINLNQN